jgi:hypothetical protein
MPKYLINMPGGLFVTDESKVKGLRDITAVFVRAQTLEEYRRAAIEDLKAKQLNIITEGIAKVLSGKSLSDFYAPVGKETAEINVYEMNVGVGNEKEN